MIVFNFGPDTKIFHNSGVSFFLFCLVSYQPFAEHFQAAGVLDENIVCLKDEKVRCLWELNQKCDRMSSVDVN